MHVLVLTPDTNNTKPIYQPLLQLGHELVVIRYDCRDRVYHNEIVETTKKLAPDWILYLGAMEKHHQKPIPSVDVLKKIGEVAPMVNLCCDGAEPDWHEQEKRYEDSGAFKLQVNIDGVRTGTIGERGLTLLYPGDLSLMRGVHADREVCCGFGGHCYMAERNIFINELVERKVLSYRARDDKPDSYQEYLRFIGGCRAVLNYSVSGSGLRQHVKARVIESAVMGCCLLELRGSPSAMWFVPGEDYLEYKGADEATERIEWVRSHQAEAAMIALSLQRKVFEHHSVPVFWSQVLERVGLGKALQPVREVVNREWLLVSR
jgi:hypothetical protein